MPKTKSDAGRLLSSICIAAMLSGACLPAMAHTTVKAQATEGVTADNALRIGHGCSVPGGSPIPVVAQSVVFPSLSPVVTSSDGTAVASLDAVIVPSSLAGLLRPIQETSIFQSQEVKVDALGNVIGFAAHDGSLAVDLLGRVPFQFAAPKFVATSCAARLLIKVAIADVCSLASSDTVAAGKVNLWIPDNGSQYASAGKPLGIDGIGSPATLIVNRDLAANPLPPACGAGVDVTVTPSAADVDANLAIPGVWGIGATGAAQPVQVVEYYNASLDHYFITWVPDEIAKLDDGSVLKGWTRTGRTMRTYKAAQAGSSPVCRFYIPPAAGRLALLRPRHRGVRRDGPEEPELHARGPPVHADVPAGPGNVPGEYAAGVSGIQQPGGRQSPLPHGQGDARTNGGHGLAGRR